MMTLAANTDWSWTLDTGVEAGTTWYFLYAYNNAGSVGLVASLTAPTALNDTNLSGATYDTNIYLGAFYNNAASNISAFTQCRNIFLLDTALTAVTHTGDTNYTAKAIVVPTTAVAVYGDLSINAANAANITPITSGGHVTITVGQETYVTCPIRTSQTIYLRTSVAGSTVSFVVNGWMDKWL
jgi:hypothetical protein